MGEPLPLFGAEAVATEADDVEVTEPEFELRGDEDAAEVLDALGDDDVESAPLWVTWALSVAWDEDVEVPESEFAPPVDDAERVAGTLLPAVDD